MVQATEARTGNHDRVRCRPVIDWASVRRIFLQGVVNAIVVMVVHVIADHSAEMVFVQRDDMVQDLAPNTPDPSFRDPVLPGRLDARPYWFETRGLQKRDHASIEFRIVVEDRVSIWGSFGKRFAQLLDDPVCSRVAGDVEMQDLSPPLFDDEKAVQQLERDRGHGEEVESHDHVAVVSEEGQPPLARVATAIDPPKISGDGPFGDDEAELLKFSVDLRGSPVRVLFGQTSDQRPDLFGGLRPAAPRPGTPAPKEPKTRAMPADDRLGLDDDEDVGPTVPEAAEGGPEEPVQGV